MNFIRRPFVWLIRIYQWTISPLLLSIFGSSARCRFTPSCSEYARQAVANHGVIRGGWLASGRLCRCHPWGKSGEDLPPPQGQFNWRKQHHCHGS